MQPSEGDDTENDLCVSVDSVVGQDYRLKVGISGKSQEHCLTFSQEMHQSRMYTSVHTLPLKGSLLLSSQTRSLTLHSLQSHKCQWMAHQRLYRLFSVIDSSATEVI